MQRRDPESFPYFIVSCSRGANTAASPRRWRTMRSKIRRTMSNFFSPKLLDNSHIPVTITPFQLSFSSLKQYSMVINNLRMATKYSFHVRKQTKKSEQKSPRADFSENRIDLVHGQTIILPTKGCKDYLEQNKDFRVDAAPHSG